MRTKRLALCNNTTFCYFMSMDAEKLLGPAPRNPDGSIDPHKALRIIPNPDGSITRRSHVPLQPASPTDGEGEPSVLSEDVPLDSALGTFVRVYIPKERREEKKLLPVIVYFHGGGFVLCSAATSIFHVSCVEISAALPAVVVSVDYRLSPEHRLPAAYDDAVESLVWIKNSSHPWIKERADLSRCFLMGGSAGGNLVYHAGVRSLDLDLLPLKIEGLILDQPFLGGQQRTESEVRLKNDRILSLVVSDLLWELCLPEGADRDHKYSNPVKNGGSVCIEGPRLPRCLVRGYLGDPMIDRQKEFAEWLDKDGRVESVVKKMDLVGFHGVEYVHPAKHAELVADIKRFVCSDVGVNSGTLYDLICTGTASKY